MSRRVLIPHPPKCDFPKPRFYVAQYCATEGEYYGLCMQRPDFSAYIEYRHCLDSAIVDAQVFTDGGEQVHCIYEVGERGWKRHEFRPNTVDRGPEWGEW